MAMDWLFGTNDEMKQMANYDPAAMKSLGNIQSGKSGIQDNPLYQAGNDWLMKLLGGDTSIFEQPLMNQFNQQIIPQIAERFGGIGAGSSSGLNQTLAQAGSTLSQQIAALRGGLMMQGTGQALQYANQPYANQLQSFQYNPYSNYMQEGSEGMLPGLLQAGGTVVGGMFGGPMGGMAGGAMGKAVGGGISSAARG